MGSPWEAALGHAAGLLHPQLRAYFGEIPQGFVGEGTGVFDVVGTPRRWLWPVLAVLARDDVIFPVWQQEVPFTVSNRPVGNTVRAERRFEFAGGARVMVDEIGATRGELWDRLGRHGRVRASLSVAVENGALVLRSTETSIAGIRIPRLIAPRLTLIEQWDDDAQCQRVTLELTAPVVGRIYEYSGSFTYELRRKE